MFNGFYLIIMIRDVQVDRFLKALMAVVKCQPERLCLESKQALVTLEKVKTIGTKKLRTIETLPTVFKYFDGAIRNAKKFSAPTTELATSLGLLLPKLSWYHREVTNLSSFSDGHANTQILGPLGIEIFEDITIGVSLLEPNLIYPEHRHKPEEVYVVMSKGEWRQGKKKWFQPSFGDLIYNPSNRYHSMRAAEDPLLAIWLLNSL